MDTVLASEIKKLDPEDNKSQESGERKGKLVSTKFQVAKTKFKAFSVAIKQAFGKVASESSHISFDAEQQGLIKLSKKLDKLNDDTAKALGLPDEMKTVQASDESPSNESYNEVVGTTVQRMSTEGNTPKRSTSEIQGETDSNVDVSSPRHRVSQVLQELRGGTTLVQPEKMYPTRGLLGDTDKIEGHQIDLIKQEEKTVVSFKMTATMVEKVKNEIVPSFPPNVLSDGSYNFLSIDGEVSDICACWVVRVDESTVIYISKGEKENDINEKDYSKPIKGDDGQIIDYESLPPVIIKHPVRALMGAVRIEVQGVADVQQISEKVDAAFRSLKITEALVNPDQQAENQYKEARYRWQHRLEDDEKWQNHREQYNKEHGVELVDHLQNKEVFPGYSTIVDPGASERYQKDSGLYLTHRVYNLGNLVSILKNGLLSSHERYKRGIFTTGMSTMSDFQTGGADSVFMRVIPKNVDKRKTYFDDTLILINPEILDRSDWYAYNWDNYGSTAPGVFDVRPSVEEFLSSQREYYSGGNEIMMRRGIPPEMFGGIVVNSDSIKNRIVEELEMAGIHDVNGITLDQFIIIASDVDELKNAKGLEVSGPESTQN